MRLPNFIAVPILVLFSSTAYAQPIGDVVDALEERLPELMEAAEIPGISIALVDEGDVVWTGAYGVQSPATQASVGRHTIFEAASLSKPVTAFIALRFVQRGDLGLDRPLHEYLPNARMDHDDRYRQITARMVLSHSTGLPNWGGDRLNLEFDPGSGFRYSGEGYVYLQRVLEKLADRPLADIARDELFDPLQMDQTSFVWIDAFENRSAFGHDAVGRPHAISRPHDANAAASLLTTAGDYGRFLATVIARKRLSSEGYDEMFSPAVEARLSWTPADASDAVKWGLGWGIDQSADLLWHWGDNGSFEAFVAGSPHTGRGFVYFANSTHGISIAEEVARLIFGRRLLAPSWAGYDPYDDPTRTAVRVIFRTFQEDGLDAGRDAIRDAHVNWSDVDVYDLSRDLARLLGEVDYPDAAVSVLEGAVEFSPDSVPLREDLADAYLQAGRFQEAAQTLRSIKGDHSASIEWIEQRLAAPAINLGEEDLVRLVGDYGPRRITIEEGRLMYQRDGNSMYELIPMSDRVFRLAGLETFRIRFEIDASGAGSSIVGLYMDGGRDETPRTR